MATLQKIRSKGPLLVIIIGLALFAFVAGDAWKALQPHTGKQDVGEINGEKISAQDYQNLVDEYTEVYKFSRQTNAVSDAELTQIKDEVWNTLVSSKIIEKAAAELGLKVTDAEMKAILATGSHPLLQQTPFQNPQTGTFDVDMLKKFLNEIATMDMSQLPQQYAEYYLSMNNYWNFIEKTLRQSLLMEKYQALISNSMISNPVAAKESYNSASSSMNLLVAAIPYTAVADSTVSVSTSDIKELYNEKKEMYKQYAETRDIKYIDIHVTASEADKAALQKEMEGYAQALAEGADPAKTVREAASQVPYSALPVSAKSLPHDIAEQLDSLSVGGQVGPFVHNHDNSINIVRLINKVSLPDSVEIRQIAAPGNDMAACEKTADSIMAALAAGADFDTIAKKYDQPATKTWITSNQYEGQVIDESNRKFISTISNAAVGSNNKIVLDGQGVIIAQVTDRRNIIDKYEVAVIKRNIDFSKDTYGKAYNDLSSFLAGNPKAEDIEANAAQAGYTVQTRKNVSSTEHNVVNVRSTREAMRWIFNEDTELGDVSPLYECGENDHLLVIILNGVHDKGYMAWDDEQIRSFLTAKVIKDKKAAILMEKMNAAQSIADVAKMEGAVTDTIKHITHCVVLTLPHPHT